MELSEQEIKEMTSLVASRNGKKSWIKRTKGKTKKEIKEMMKKIRNSKIEDEMDDSSGPTFEERTADNYPIGYPQDL